MNDINRTFEELSEYFRGTLPTEDEVVIVNQLDRSRLDYSVSSLKTIDEYLFSLHNHWSGLLDRDWTRTVVRCGAYVGEVIRRCAPRPYNWVDFDTFVNEFPETAHMIGTQRQVGTTALLTQGNGSFTLPLNKVLCFIHDGRSDSVWFYASCEVKER